MRTYLMLLIITPLLSACSRDFDSEYNKTEEKLQSQSQKIEQDLDQQMQAELGGKAEDKPVKTK